MYHQTKKQRMSTLSSYPSEDKFLSSSERKICLYLKRCGAVMDKSFSIIIHISDLFLIEDERFKNKTGKH